MTSRKRSRWSSSGANMGKIDYDELFRTAYPSVLEAGVDFPHGTDHTVLVDVIAEARRRGLSVRVMRHGRLSEVAPANRDALGGCRFPVVVVQVVGKIEQPSAEGERT